MLWAGSAAGWSRAAERLPAANLIVELRWVDASLAPAAQAAVRDGAVVVGTGGVVSPRGSVLMGSTSTPSRVEDGPRLQLANGEAAELLLREREPLQWVEAVVDLNPAAAASAGPRILARPMRGERVSTQRYAVAVQWPGRQAPARLRVAVQGDAGPEIATSLLLPLDEWHVVARTGAAPAAPPPRGQVSTRDLQAQPARELQARIRVAP
jgi:hypothetical protein